ncbi:MAG: hypothetical protein AB4372_21145 [Xenococcus sp. (in: cyanobacteria)]
MNNCQRKLLVLKKTNLQKISLSQLEQICGGGVDPDTNPPPTDPGKHSK